MNKREALKILDVNIRQADAFCQQNEVSKEDKEYVDAVKIARDVLEFVIKLQDVFIKE